MGEERGGEERGRGGGRWGRREAGEERGKGRREAGEERGKGRREAGEERCREREEGGREDKVGRVLSPSSIPKWHSCIHKILGRLYTYKFFHHF